MITFGLGIAIGIFIGRFWVVFKGLWERTEKKLIKKIDETNK